MSDVRVRFAPSPTGKVHIGNIRAAIYNWLYARHVGGKFLLRIEDTDLERSTPEAIKALLECMEWLGLDYDEPAVYQTKNLQRHLDCVKKLLADGRAYECEKTSRDGKTGKVVMFRMPKEGVVAFDDIVKGHMEKKAEDVQDFAIVRSDGSPIFHLANVVDDIDQGVTHVIRGDDHVENTFKHIELFKALGATPPKYGHLSMIVNAQGKPYSKRDGAAFVGEFREQGYLPDALFNYLLLLGWNPGDEREVLTKQEMIDLFDIEKVHVTAAKFDLKKLQWMNGEYIRKMPIERFIKEVRGKDDESFDNRFSDKFNLRDSSEITFDDVENDSRLKLLGEQLQVRTKLFTDIPSLSACFCQDIEDASFYDEKAVEKRLRKPGVGEVLRDLRSRFEKLEPFNAIAGEKMVKELSNGNGMGQWVHPLRVALSGHTEGIGIFEMCEILGREETLKRLDYAINNYSMDESQLTTSNEIGKSGVYFSSKIPSTNG